MSSIKKDILFNTLSNFLQFGTRWFLNIILARSFSPILYGEFTLLYSLATLLSSLFAFGSNLFLLHKAREDVSILIRSIILTISIFLITLFIAILMFHKYLLMLFLALALALNINLFSFYKGLGWFNKEAKFYFLFSVILLILAFLTVKGIISSINTLLISIVIINFIIFLIGFWYLCIRFHCKLNLKINLTQIKNELIERSTYGIHEFLSILFKNLEFVLLSIYAGNQFLGEYRAIYNIVFPFYIIATITSQVLLSKLSVSVTDKKRILLKKFTIITGFTGFLLFVVLYEMYPLISQILYGSKFMEKTYKLIYLIMLINLVVYLVKSNFEVGLTAMGKQVLRVKVLLLSIFILIIIDFFAVKLESIFGHSLVILLVNTFMLFIYLIEILKWEAK